MNTLLNIKAFLRVARTSSFSAAAKELDVAPSVVTKRITQLETQMGVQLFIRSTRGLTLTDAGEHYLPRYQRLIAEFDETINGDQAKARGIEGHLRIKAPTTITSLFLGSLFCEFHVRHPGLTLDITLMDRSVNPMEEGFDLVIAATPASYPNVVNMPLCAYPLIACSAPAYLQERGRPQHPTDLVDYECLTSVLLGSTWLFEGNSGQISVEVRSKFHANDTRVLHEAALRGIGLAALPRFMVDEDLREGRLVTILDDYPLALFWLKVLVPRIKMNKAPVSELVAFLQEKMHPTPPWELSN